MNTDSSILRILDANFNRAGEALRVLEEHARMALNDEALSRRAKGLRHDLAAARNRLPAAALLAARDVSGDVGTRIDTPSESVRPDTAAIATAAARRAAEALRCIEEYGKTVDAPMATAVEAIRYATYTLERDICIQSPIRARLAAARLHVLITESLSAGAWMDVAARAIDGGADVLQLREKSIADRELLNRAKRLRDLTRERGVLFAMNDRPDLARLAGADILHVGQDDLGIEAARRIAGPAVLIGKSTHDTHQLQAVLREAPDYIAVGPMFASRTKPDSVVAGPELLKSALSCTTCPVVAIGGIDVSTVTRLPHDSRVQIAVCQAVIAAPDPAAATRALKQAMTSHPSE